MRLIALILFPCLAFATPPRTTTIGNDKISLSVEYGDKACITSMLVGGQKVIGAEDGAFTSIRVNGVVYSSLHLLSAPTLTSAKDSVVLDGIVYGGDQLTVREKWVFITRDKSIKWKIERLLSGPVRRDGTSSSVRIDGTSSSVRIGGASSSVRADGRSSSVRIDGASSPEFNFDAVNTWDGAYQGYGGLAWFYLFNERLCTYGVHTTSSSFWNARTGKGLDVIIDAPGRKVAMKYTRTNEDRLSFGVTVADREMLPKYDSGTNRRRFIRGKTDVWAPFEQAQGKSSESITLGYFDVAERYGRGRFVGIDGARVSAVLNTIVRIGVIDSLHYGGNSWHTPYGPICLHEQYIAQMGLAINDPHYLKGYQSCLDFYRDHAIKPDGRVFPRWAYTDEDMMPGGGSKEGFYEAQWGILMDANPDFVTNVAELYDQTGNTAWVKGHQRSCEKALDWILARDSNGNGLVEMETDNETQKKSSDWIDIIWASYENAFVNAKLYHALVKWAAIERQLNNTAKAGYYEAFATRLKASFNKSTKDGGFWDEEAHCYVHWLDKDGSAHGRNWVTPVNFMAIAYGICDDTLRQHVILDSIENKMQRENLFFWPLCMTSYAPGEGKEWQFPFPGYENGDIFLSWGSIAAAAYASYRPDVAVKYIKKVLDQYAKDGLAFQRYGRRKQDGLGDDILSGNSLSIVGLYQAIYGINPLYNRFYLNPHLTPELSGTELKYNFRGTRLTIGLDTGSYSVGDGLFTIKSFEDFGFFHVRDSLFYFHRGDSNPALQAISTAKLTISIGRWTQDEREWTQSPAQPVRYIVHQLAPGATYAYFVDGKRIKTVRSDAKGQIQLRTNAGGRIALRLASPSAGSNGS